MSTQGNMYNVRRIGIILIKHKRTQYQLKPLRRETYILIQPLNKTKLVVIIDIVLMFLTNL